MKNQDICWISASDLAQAIKKKKLSPVEIVKSLLERVNNVNPKINAYVTIVADSALAQAREAEIAVMKGDKCGALHGVPFGVKDVTFTKGVRTTMGSKLMESFVPDEDALHVARLKQAGAIMLGKTNCSEFASGPMTQNLVFGKTLNPWDVGKIPGGSSGGSGAAVAAGLGPLATGNDAGGSVRGPASMCGVVGFIAQFGRVPVYQPFHLLDVLGREGAITRTVQDAALMLDIMSGLHWGDYSSVPAPDISFASSLRGGVKGLKVAWSLDLGFATVSRQVRAIFENAVKRFAEMGAHVEEARPDLGDPEAVPATLRTIISADLGAMLSSTFGPLDEIKPRLHPTLAIRVTETQNLSAHAFLKATFNRRDISARICKFFEDYDLLLTPTCGVPAWATDLPTPTGFIQEVDGKPVAPHGWQLGGVFNLTGQPAVSIPGGWTEDGLPVGLQIVGRPYDEATVFRAAAAFEEAQPWADKRPPL